MQNKSQLGCFGFLALVVGGYFLWIAILYVGVPLAVAGIVTSTYLFKKYPDDHGRASSNTEDMRFFAAALAGASIVLGTASIAGNIFTDSGPFGKVDKSEVVSKTTNQQSDSRLADICTEAVLEKGDDPNGAIAYMNGNYESSEVKHNSDGTTLVSLERSRANAGGRCKSRLVASCMMRGTSVSSSTSLKEDGFYAC